MSEGSTQDGQSAERRQAPGRSDDRSPQVPAITLPKGGGAVRGIGEKFAANPVNGTGTMSVPIATSPGRSDFGPRLELSYDSGSGNGPFGYGWTLSTPAITRKTDLGLPRYHDGDESDDAEHRVDREHRERRTLVAVRCREEDARDVDDAHDAGQHETDLLPRRDGTHRRLLSWK